MKSWFGVTRVTNIGTGVDVHWFSRPPAPAPVADIVFLGSMNWSPNADGVQFFVERILPIIRKRVPETTVALVGRDPQGRVLRAARTDPAISVTGTVPDVRPYLWGAGVSVVPSGSVVAPVSKSARRWPRARRWSRPRSGAKASGWRPEGISSWPMTRGHLQPTASGYCPTEPGPPSSPRRASPCRARVHLGTGRGPVRNRPRERMTARLHCQRD